jgi:hypothetical protein
MVQQKPAAKSAAGAAPRFEIKKWNAVAMWSWDICADTVSLSFWGGVGGVHYFFSFIVLTHDHEKYLTFQTINFILTGDDI